MLRDRLFVTGVAVWVAAALLPVPVAAQGKTFKLPRTSDGRPDLQGVYTFSTITPLERPMALAGKESLSQEEAAAFEASENRRLNRDLFDPIKGAPSAGYPSRAEGGVLSYNEFWYERGNKLTSDKRTSLIVDPPDGRLPMTPAARQKAAAEGKRMYEGFADSYTDRTLADRCLVGFNAGPPMIPGAYNNNMQIVQTAKDVVIFTEMVHTARIIPIDGRPHGTMRRWSGDSRGRWEGDTLVVETHNFLRETSLRGSSADTRLVERFTLVDENTIKYEFTVTDPHSYTRAWTAVVPLVRTDDPIFEYACHEGNYAMEGILKGARLREKLEAGK
jgi:hypothetical protein